MNKKWMLGFMSLVVTGLTFVTASSILPGCAAQTPAVTVFDQTSTVTHTPTMTFTMTCTSTPTP